MVLNNSITEEEAITILAAADFTVQLSDKTFSVWKDGSKVYGFSNRKDMLTNLNFVVKQIIISYYVYKGKIKGVNETRNNIKTFLGIDT